MVFSGGMAGVKLAVSGVGVAVKESMAGQGIISARKTGDFLAERAVLRTREELSL